MANRKNIRTAIIGGLAYTGWLGISILAGKGIGKCAGKALAKNPTSKPRQIGVTAATTVALIGWSYLGSKVGELIGDHIADNLEFPRESKTMTPEERRAKAESYDAVEEAFKGFRIERNDDPETDTWDPFIEMEPKATQV